MVKPIITGPNETLLKIDANLIIIVARLMSPSSRLPLLSWYISSHYSPHGTDWTWTLITAHQGGWTQQLSVQQ